MSEEEAAKLSKHWAKLALLPVVLMSAYPIPPFLISLVKVFAHGRMVDEGLTYSLGMLIALAANWGVLAAIIFRWGDVARTIPAAERTRLGLLVAYPVVQVLHLAAMGLISLMLLPLLSLASPHDMGFGMAVGSLSGVLPSIPSVLLGFLVPRVLYPRLRPGSFLGVAGE